MVFVRGIGRTKFGILEQSLPELLFVAINRALQDADLPANEVDAVYVANFLGSHGGSQLHLGSLVAGMFVGLNLPIIRVEAACASGGAALYQAHMALQTFDNVLVVGGEKMSDMASSVAGGAIAMAGDRYLDQAEGVVFPASYALLAQQHMMKYGTTVEDMNLVSFKSHQNARQNPYAHFSYKDVTMDLIRQAPMVSSPLTLLHCSPISDGAAAVVLSRSSSSSRDVKIASVALATDSLSLSERDDLTGFNATRRAAELAYEGASIGPTDVDVFQVHDCFAIAELIAMEDIGICAPGESAVLVREGKTAIGGPLPVNTDGGLKADGHPIGASGLAQVYEAIVQIRGDAGSRQIRDVRIGLAQNIGGVGGTAVVTILEKV